MRSVTPIIDYSDPINDQCDLSRGLVNAWITLPQNCGSARLMDLLGANHGSLVNFEANGVGTGWLGSFGCPGAYRTLYGNVPANSYISTTAVSASGVWTVSGWFLTGTFDTGYQATFWFGSGTGYGGMVIDGPTRVMHIFGSGASEPSGGLVGTWPSDVLWHHLAITRDGTNYIGYLDGVAQGSVGCGTWGASTDNLRIMGRSDTNQAFQGLASDFMLHNRTLSDREVMRLYQESRTGYKKLLRWVRPVGYSSPAAPAGLSIPIAAYHYNHHLGSMT